MQRVLHVTAANCFALLQLYLHVVTCVLSSAMLHDIELLDSKSSLSLPLHLQTAALLRLTAYLMFLGTKLPCLSVLSSFDVMKDVIAQNFTCAAHQGECGRRADPRGGQGIPEGSRCRFVHHITPACATAQPSVFNASCRKPCRI